MFKKVLIANRGEIAVRVMRACREMGIATVAVYSEVDRLARHVLAADEAYCVGPAPSSQSYLVAEKILDVAKKSGAEAIHPGYGFLAENHEFAIAVAEAGLVFIGPPPEAIRLLGDKIEARKTMITSGVPCIPGCDDAVTSAGEAKEIAESFGYPVLLKAAAGGGGKGMRVVRQASELESALRGAMSEAMSAFGSDRVFVEKYIEEPRHIEIQVIADSEGKAIWLGERECSIQRRHQKVVEEAPSPIVDDALRQRMGEAAVAAVNAAGYVNAGTVEFLVDKKRDFYFLEVNTRLQVEHPVTEMVIGFDLVKEQLRVAAGEGLSFNQEGLRMRGHAVECRIYAEDAAANFMPSTGTLRVYREPSGPGVRVDSGVAEGDTVSVYYDPLLAKLVCWGKDREEAIDRCLRALSEYRIVGVETAVPFHSWILSHPRFRAGDLSTHFLQEEFGPQTLAGADENERRTVALATAIHAFLRSDGPRGMKSAKKGSGGLTASQWKQYARRAGVATL